MELYNESEKSKKFVIYFENEEAVEEGVTRETYTLFFEHMYQSFLEGENEKIPLSTVSPEFLWKISFIIANAFIHYEVFPVKLCKVSLKTFYLAQQIQVTCFPHLAIIFPIKKCL